MTRLMKFNLDLCSFVLVLCVARLLQWAYFPHAEAGDVPPDPKLVVPCEIVSWHDGDTGTVRIVADLRVRLSDCWAPELTGRRLTEAERKLPGEKQREILERIAAEKQRGIDSLNSIQRMAPPGTKGQLEISLAGVERSDDLFTLGRVLGRVWVNGQDLSARQVAAGQAKSAK
jgi:endonuclease YncB( thermonuclease family)